SPAGAAVFQLAVHRPLKIELQHIARGTGDLRPRIEIAGPIMVLAIDQDVERLALVQGARAHRLDQGRQPEMPELLVQAGDFGFNDLIGLGIQGAARVPIGEEQQRRHRNREQQHINKNNAESLSLIEARLSAHGSYSPRRARYAAAALRSLYRS